MKKFLLFITAIAVMLGGFAFTAPAASAATPQEPVVDLNNVQYGSASFEADGSSAAKASLTAKSGAKVVLNVRVNPMPKRQVKKCWSVKPGIWIKNEVIDPATGGRAVINWQVPKGDNVFCYKKGAGKQVFKKSCGNRVWGVPGGPKSPPRSLPRIKGTVQIQDYLTAAQELELLSKLSGSASAHVVQYDDAGNKVCEASASVSGSAEAWVRMWIKVKSRTTTGISFTAANQAEVKASADTTIKGMLQSKVKTHLEGKAMAMCNYTPPPNEEPPPPPPVDHKPAVNIMGSPAHLYVGGNAYVWIEASDPDGDAVSVQVSASGAGTVAGLVPVDIRWDGTPCPSGKSCFRATAWAGNTPGNMTITATVTANGLSGEPDSVTFPVLADEF